MTCQDESSRLSGRAVALLIFLSAPARTRIIPAYFGARADRLGLLGLRSSRLKLHFLLLAALAALDFAGFVFRAGGLDQEKIAYGLGVNAPHHVFKQREGFFFEFDQRILLSVAAQADAFLQVIER
jgi:hypothetical protein